MMRQPDPLRLARAPPFSPLAALFGFQIPPAAITLANMLLVALGLICAESLKRFANRAIPRRRGRSMPMPLVAT